MAALAADGKAIVLWQSSGSISHHISTVDLRSGVVRTTFAGTDKTGIRGLTANNWDVELVRLKDGRAALLYLDRFASAKPNPSDNERHRFRLAPLTESGPKGNSIKLDGGQPIYADVGFDLASLRTNPKKAICGSPCLLMGNIVNRGSRDANKVRLEVMVDSTWPRSAGTTRRSRASRWTESLAIAAARDRGPPRRPAGRAPENLIGPNG